MSEPAHEMEILPVMIGTAGHVDHGKTALVNVLTGCATDTLKEEQQRGLTIDLGFAPCAVGNGKMAGIIDVPGHIDFIKNMVAGAASLDVLMLIVAADDSVMPQTIEHLQIVRLLRMPLLMCVITKIDLVEPDMLELIKEDVRAFLDKAGYPDAPICPMSNVTFEGLTLVRKTLELLVEKACAKRAADPLRHQAFRMNIERVFSIKGHGTVVTGVPSSGQPEIGQSLTLYPSLEQGRIRGVQNYRYNSGHIVPNACNAVNISDIPAEKITRGMTLAIGDVYSAVDRVTAAFTNVARVPLTDDAHVRFHAGTAAVNAKVTILGKKSIAPGEEGFIQIRLDEPLLLLAADHYILRRFSPSETWGGGQLLSVQNGKYKRTDESLVRRLNACKAAIGNYALFESELYAAPEAIVDLTAIAHSAGLEKEPAKAILADCLTRQVLFPLGGDFALVNSRQGETAARAQSALKLFHSQKAYSWGMEMSVFARVMRVPADCARPLAERLCEAFPNVFKMGHARLSLASFAPQITRRQMKQKEDLLAYLESCEAKVPAFGVMLETFSLTPNELKFLIKILIEGDEVVQVGNHVFAHALYTLCMQSVLELGENNAVIDINALRDKTGLSRNMTVEFLEHLDGKGLTRRLNQGRVLLPRSERRA